MIERSVPAGATVADYTERELITRIQARLASPPGWLIVGIGDDAAVVEPERNRVEVLTVDAIVDGVHFDRAIVPPEAIGHRALAVNLSDLAAMGAAPRLALVSMALPGDLPAADFDGIATGLAALATRHGAHVVGGNLTRTPGPLALDITVIGTIKRRQALIRGGARPDDCIYMSGDIGAAAAGLARLRDAGDPSGPDRDACIEKYWHPRPRLRVGTLLARNRIATACIDLSDGLADGVRQIADASGVSAALDAAAIPVHPAAQEWFTSRGADPLDAAIGAGDDYELLFTIRPRSQRRLEAVLRRADVAVTRIGTCGAGRGATLTRSDGQTVAITGGYGHFR